MQNCRVARSLELSAHTFIESIDCRQVRFVYTILLPSSCPSCQDGSAANVRSQIQEAQRFVDSFRIVSDGIAGTEGVTAV